jgi:hypothetical protein
MAAIIDPVRSLDHIVGKRQTWHRKKEVGPARDPALAVEREPAAGHDHLHVRMMGECRTPRMENRQDADASTRCLESAAIVSIAFDEALNGRP